MRKPIQLSLVLMCCLASCAAEKQDTALKEPKSNPESASFLSDFCDGISPIKRDDFKCAEFRIDLPFNYIGEELYSTIDNDLLFLTHDFSWKGNIVFIRSTTFQGKRQALSRVIDTETWEQFGFLYRDKNNIYCHHMRADGGALWVLEDFNPSDVFNLHEYDGKDAKFLQAIKIAKAHHAIATDGKRSIDIRCDVKLIN